MKTLLLFFFLLFATSTSLFSAATFTENSTAQQLANQIQGVGITISDPVITFGDGNQVGIFSNGIAGANLEIDEGIILTTLSVAESFTTNDAGNKSIFHSNSRVDADLTGIDLSAIRNTVVFEFDVTLDDNTRLLLIDYQFAAEEYNEYVGTVYNDAFGFFISGGDLNQTYNIARVIDNQTFVTVDNIDNYNTVTVNNVNNGVQGASHSLPRDVNITPVYTNTAFYIDNDQNNQGGASPVTVEYDGLTVSLHATLDNLTPGETYHFKMAIADTSDAQLNTGVFVNKINGLREPSICYDYAYKQNGKYITADYDGTAGPTISGNVIANDTNYPIDVSMYIKNTKDSEIVASNILLDIFNLDIAQATYKYNTVWVTETGELYPTMIPDSPDLNVSSSYIKGIPIDSFNAFEYFYTYFSIDPLVEDLNLSISSRISYDLTIPLSPTQNLVVNRSSLIDTDIPICSTSSAYDPVPGIFSVVHNDYYNLDLGGTQPFYNIPTQVTSREGNFKVISLDVNNTDQLEGRSTVVAVELVDISAFHDTQASCSEQSNAISKRVWVTFDNNSTSTMFDQTALSNAISTYMTQLDSSSEFYTQARSNAAFRISYNVPNDNDELLIVTDGKKAGTYDINFPDLTTLYGQNCAGGRSVVYDKAKGKTTNMIPVACKSNSDITPENLQSCMECIYGYNTKFVCSRDNFAIRPEAFLMHIDDQNQTNTLTPQKRLTTDYSGVSLAVAGATIQELNLASGYAYNIEINATNHLNNTSSVGYIKSFGSLNITDTAQFIWEPRDITVFNASTLCNDTNDTNITNNPKTTLTFFNGSVDTNISHNQVGEYRLSILDTSWTDVDGNPTYMTHHTGAYFTSALDCTINSNKTYTVGSAIDLTDATSLSNTLTGCNISTKHTGSASNLQYNDYDMEFHPYKFAIDTDIKLGLKARDFNTTNDFFNFVYMSNINVPSDVNMSVHFNSTIAAKPYSGPTLTNFVTGCYAKPIDINISKTTPLNTGLTTRYILHDLNSTGVVNGSIAPSISQDANVTTNALFFIKDLNGTLISTMNINFDRNQNLVANPEDINYTHITVADPRTLINADLMVNYDANGSVRVDQNVTHYFGRTAARKTRIVCDPANATCSSGLNGEPNVLIYYEAYCFDNTNGNVCNRNLIPTAAGNRLLQKVDSRWYMNLSHKEIGDGNLTVTIHDAATPLVFVPNTTTLNNFTKNSQHNYAISNGLPYEASMLSIVPNWLIYDAGNPFAIMSPHLVIFQPATAWTGKHDTRNEVTTQTDRVRRVNRRTMW